VIGMGVDPPASLDANAILARHAIPHDFVLYLGRVDKNKGCDTLLEYFQEYAATHSDATLVLAGPAKMQIPEHPRIRALGYVADDLRNALLASARAMVIPSPYESLSIVLLEAWNHGVPALVNAGVACYGDKYGRANGGLYYRSSRDFEEALTVPARRIHESETRSGRRDASMSIRNTAGHGPRASARTVRCVSEQSRR
jgi:glycosyltransferase involved in cell wall biosynthesis